MNIVSIPSPNYFRGRASYQPIAIVIHTMEGSLAGTDSWFQNPVSKVSAHYGIGINREIHQYVQETDSAWHAGRVNDPSWQLIIGAGNGTFVNPNLYTIGIEHEGDMSSDWPDAIYESSAELIRSISARWTIPLDRDHLIAHHEIYSPKSCPGNLVDLNRLINLAGGRTVSQSALAQAGPPRNGALKILQLGKARTTCRLNIRSSPDRSIPPVRTVGAGAQLIFDGFTEQGEPIYGNKKWFYAPDGTWFWSGGTKII